MMMFDIENSYERKIKMFYENVVPSLQHFLQSPSHDNLKEVLLNNSGETDFLDFKMKWSDFTKLAKHILAIANSGGGSIIVGVLQNEDGSVSLTGVKDEHYLDKADIDNKLQHLLPKYLKFRVEDFYFSNEETTVLKSKLFQVLLIEYDPKYVPYTSISNRNELRYGAIYIRQGTKSMEATNEKLVEMIVRKVQTGGSESNDLTLKEHLLQLKDLIEELDGSNPQEYQDFIKHIITLKKKRIQQYLDLSID
jgi:predicted HTH transcriptional regulator